MASFNRIIMMGNLTRDPDHKQLNSGQSVCKLGLASNRQFKNRQTGTMNQEVCFVDVEVWGAQADNCQQYLSKGKPVLVEGRLKLDTWEDASGGKRNRHYIVAERVTFLSNVVAQDASTSDESSLSDSADFEGFSSSEDAAPKKKKETKSRDTLSSSDVDQKTSTIGEIEFKNEQPFDDELPF